MFTGVCPLSHGYLTGTFTSQVGEAGVTPSFTHVTFQVSGNGRTCDFSGFAPHLQLIGPLFATLDGAYQCSDAAGTMTQTGRFSAALSR